MSDEDAATAPRLVVTAVEAPAAAHHVPPFRIMNNIHHQFSAFAEMFGELQAEERERLAAMLLDHVQASNNVQPSKIMTTKQLVDSATDADVAELEESLRKQRLRTTLDAPKLLLVMVGLPARGKSFLVKTLSAEPVESASDDFERLLLPRLTVGLALLSEGSTSGGGARWL